MAAPTLPQPRKAFRLSKLQALLLLGGAFVLGVGTFAACRYRLVRDTSPTAPPSSVAAISFLRRDRAFLSGSEWMRFLAALPKEARAAVNQSDAGQTATLFAVRGEGGGLRWGLVEALNVGIQGRKPRWRLVPKHAAAIGFVEIGGYRQPLNVDLTSDFAMFRIGRDYRGWQARPPARDTGRRLLVPLPQQMAYLEKPPGASWERLISLFARHMQRFGILTAPWTWPGRVELAISASATETPLQPFVLYNQRLPNQAVPRAQVESFAKDLLAAAVPEALDVTLPDDTRMTELRDNPDAIRVQRTENRFGELVKLAAPKDSASLSIFHADVGETWISNDLHLIQTALVSSVGAPLPTSACQKGGAGGFASFSGHIFQDFGQFSLINISILNLETGVFIMCGYY